MPVGLQTKYGKRILAIVGCFVIWLLYTLIFRQIIRFDNNNVPAKNLDLKQETYEIDQRVSVCFKDVAPFSMLLKQDANVCRNIHDLLIVVHTDPTNFQLRTEFRKTLRKVKKEATIHNLQIGTVFMLGLDKDQCISSTLLQEMSLKKDILICSFIDSNENQTLKSVNTLKWFHENCSNSKLLLKLDANMDPSTSFSTKQFYKFIKSWRNEDIVLLGSLSLPMLFSKSDPVSYFSSTTTSLVPISAQYLHLNYLLSRNVVISLLKARADAINISAWKEDLFVTGVLANVAQIRPKHDERFLRQCAGTLCIFCECLVDLERQIDFSRPYYFAQSLTQREDLNQPLRGFISQSDSTWSTIQYESTAGTDHTLPTSTNGAETFSTELSTLTSTRSILSETTSIPQNEFTTRFKSIGVEITTTGSTPTMTNIPDSTTFPPGKTDTTSEMNSQFTELLYTTTEHSFQSVESEDFIVTATTPKENNIYSSTVTESLENKITDLGSLTTDAEKFYSSPQQDSHTIETDVTQSSKMNIELDVTIRTTTQEACDLYSSTSDQKMGTEPASTILELDVDSKTISTSYPTTDLTESTETERNPDVTSSSISDEFVRTVNVILKNDEDEFQEVNEQQGLSSTNTVEMTDFNIETTTPTYFYVTEDDSLTGNPTVDSVTGGIWSGDMQQNFRQTTTTQATEFQTQTVYESSSVHTDATTEDSLRATTIELDAVGEVTSHSPLSFTFFKSEKQNLPEITTNIEDELLTEPALQSTSANLTNITTDSKLITNFQTDASTTQDTSTVVNNVIFEGATLTDTNAEVTEYSAPSTCNPISVPREAEFFTVPTQPENLESIQTTTEDLNNERVLLKESFQNSNRINEIESATEIFLHRFNYSSHKIIQDLKNLTGFVENTLKTNLTGINQSSSSNLASSYVPTNNPVDSTRTTFKKNFNFTSNQTNFSEKKRLADVVNKSSSTSIEQNSNKYFSSRLMSYETDSTTRKYVSTSKIDHESNLDSEEDDNDKVTKIPILKEFETSLPEKDLKKDLKKVDFIQTTIPRRRVKVRISSSTSKSETFRLKSALSSSSKIEVRVTSSTSMATKGMKKSDHRKLRRKRKMKKIMIRIRKMFLKLPTTIMTSALKKSTYPSTFQKSIIA